MSSLELVPLGDVATVTGGLTKNAKRDQLPLKRPYLTVANVYANRLELEEVGQIGIQEGELARVELRHDDLLVVEGNGSLSQLGRVALWTGVIEGCVHQNHLIKVRPTTDVTPKWILYWLLSPEGRRAIEKVGSSTSGLHTLSISKVQGLPVPMRPVGDQHRIVAAIETHFSRLDAAVASLTRAKANVKRARASVLKAAVEGRLVPTEAALARTEGRDYEPASTLLARILVERQAAWAASGAKGKYKEPVAPDTEGLPELPEGWWWTSVDQLAGEGGRGLCDGPFGSNLKSAHYTESGPRVVRLQNIGDGIFRDERAHVSQAHFDSLMKHAVEANDLVIASLGETLPRACVVPEWLGQAIVKADCIRFRTTPTVLPTYLNVALNSQPVRQRTTEQVHGIGRPRLGLAGIREIAVPLPPLAEQHRIVAEVDRRLSVLDTLDTTLDANLARCGRLRQSILKRAFEGRLVSDDVAQPPGLARSVAN